MQVIDKLDIRRAQVLVEAVVVEVNADKTADLGVNWAAWSSGSKGTQIPAGSFVEPIGGTSIADVASTIEGIANGSSSSTSSLTGTTLALGKLSSNGINFGAMLRALNGDASTNIVATPSAVTLDNQEAELKVAQEVPFITGQYANTGSTSASNSSVSPFTTVQRQEVGTILKVTPQISTESDSVILKISVESSSVAATSVSSVDITTNKRTVSTSVMIEDGGIVVLGGLISDTATKSEQRIPWLGSLPYLGALFRTRDHSRTRNNLMIFIRPKILRTPEQTAIESGAKYNHMLEEQRRSNSPGPGAKEDSPVLAPLAPRM